MSKLNPPQRAAVRYVDGPLLVLAGAGSGKTRVITEKIAHLIRACAYAPREIAAVTFTNKAAREMQARVGKLLRGQDTEGLAVSTFHSLGIRILRRECKLLGYKPSFSILDSGDSLQMLTQIARAARLGLEPAVFQARISAWKNQLISPETAVRDAQDDIDAAAAGVYVEYQRHLRASNAFDFDDLILQPVMLLRAEAAAREHWRGRIRHLLVDEYQDTNHAQYELVRELVGTTAAFTAVGDDDQSIYSWRGAQPENLLRLRDDFPALKVVKLEQNYRSSGCILQAANRLIANNPHVFEKRLWSELGPGDRLRVFTCKDAEHEAERVVSEILRHQFQHGAKFGDFAILYRGNHQSRPFERVLREHRIPYQVSGGMSFFEYGEVKDLVAYLRLLVNGDDDRAFLRIVNTPRREIGVATIERVNAFATKTGQSLLAACCEVALAEHLGARAYARVQTFARMLVEYSDRAERGDPVAAVRGLVADIGYADWLRDGAQDPKDAERRLQNLDDFLGWLVQAAKALGDNATLRELVTRMSLLDLLDREQDEAQPDRVHLATLHAAKGLEFPHVFLVGMEDGLLPHRASVEADSLAEERRLAYVGMTRARRTLTFTCAERRKRNGGWAACEPSRFLAELPQEDLVWDTPQDIDPQARQDRGQAHLSNLRGLLS